MRSKSRPRLREKSLLLDARTAPQYRVAMREAPEPGDDFMMASRVIQVIGARQCGGQRLEQCERPALDGDIFGMLEGQVQEDALERTQHEVAATIDGLARRAQRDGIGGKGARSTAEHVAGKLIQEDDERQTGERTLNPRPECARRGPFPEGEKAPPTREVEILRFLKPELARSTALGRIGTAEPEIEDLLKIVRHDEQQRAWRSTAEAHDELDQHFRAEIGSKRERTDQREKGQADSGEQFFLSGHDMRAVAVPGSKPL